MKKVAVTLLMFTLGLGIVLMLNVKGCAEGSGNYPPPKNGDWIINNETHVWNETIVLNGNLSVENGGKLIFNNVTLKMNCKFDGEYGISVENGGDFYILDYDNSSKTTKDKSYITANNTNYKYKFLVDSGAKFEMKNSEIRECGYRIGDDGSSGLTIKTNFTKIENSRFYNNIYGIYFLDSHNNTLINSTFTNNKLGILFSTSTNNTVANNIISLNFWGIYVSYFDNNNLANNTVSKNSCGINLSYSGENLIKNNNIYSNYFNGIYLDSSNDNNILDNNIYYNNWSINLSSSSNNKIINNKIYSNNLNGISFTLSMTNTISNNNIYSNYNGIYLKLSMGNVVENNNIYSHDNYGISLKSSQNSKINNNNISNNDVGIYFFRSINNQITNNSIYSNNAQGISLLSSSNKTLIINNLIPDNDCGIYIASSNNCSIIDNNVSFNAEGIFLITLINCQIKDNDVSNNNYGISISSSKNITMRNNFISNNKYNFGITSNEISNYYHDIDTSNKINGKPIIYIIGNNNITLDENAIGGYFGFVSCSNIIVKNLTIKNNTQGILFVNTNNSQINNCDIIYNKYGISLLFSNKNKITNTRVNFNNYNGIYIISSHNNQIIDCNVSSNKHGISIISSNNYKIKNVSIVSNTYNGIYISSSTNIEILRSTISKNSRCIYLSFSVNNYLLNSSISKSLMYDLQLAQGSNITLLNTTFNKNKVIFEDKDSEITVLWYLHVKVLDENNLPAQNAKVIVINKQKIEIYNGTTLQDGWVRWIVCTEYIQNKLSFIFYTNHTITAEINEDQINRTIEMNESKFIVLGYYYIILECQQNEKSTNPGKEVNYSIKIINKGLKLDNISLEIINLSSWLAHLNSYNVTLAPSQEITVFLTIIPPKDELAGNTSTFIVKGISENNPNVWEFIKIKTIINQVHNSTLYAIQTNFKLAPGNTLQLNLTIQNLGNDIDNFKISVNHTASKNLDYWKIEPIEIIKTLEILEISNLNFTVISPKNATANSYAKIVFEVCPTNYENLILDKITFRIEIKQIHNLILISKKTELSGKPGETIIYTINITNNGNGAETISFELSGKNYEWGNLDSKYLVLEVSESRNVNLNVLIPKHALKDEKAIINVTAIAEIEKFSISTTTTVEQIHKFSLTSDSLEEFADPGEGVFYYFIVKNNGNADDIFKFRVNFSASTIPKDWKILPEEVDDIIKFNENKIIIVKVTPSINAKANEKALIVFEVLSIENIVMSSIETKTTVNQIYDFTLAVDSLEKSVNPGSNVNYLFTIENIGRADGNVTLRVNLTDSKIPKNWIIEPIKINETINVNEEKLISVSVSPPINGLALEKAEIVFEVVSVDNLTLDSVKTTTTINQIYKVKLEIDKNEDIVNLMEKVLYKVNVINLGNGKDIIRLELSGQNSNWGYLNESIFTLDIGKSKFVTLTVKAPDSAINGEQSIIKIHAISSNGNISNILLTTTTVMVPENKVPKADFKITYKNRLVTKVIIGRQIIFDASLSFDEDGEIVEYCFDFGNGVVMYGEKIVYSYPKNTQPGKYTVTLRVKDNNGAISEKQITIEVLEEEEENWLLYFILVVILIICLILVIMIGKVMKAQKYLEEVKPPQPYIEKREEVAPTLIEEEIKEKVEEGEEDWWTQWKKETEKI